jgi:hypothetical protein
MSLKSGKMGIMRSYQTDYVGWAEDTARAICEGRWSDIDRAALADEVADLGKQVQQRMESRLIVLFHHLLKQRYQPQRVSRSWELAVREQRLRALKILRENPTLKSVLPDLMEDAYAASRLRAAKETGLPLEEFPIEMPFTEAEIWG